MGQKQYRCKKELEKHEEENHNCYLCQKQYRCKKELDEHEEEDHRWGCEKCRNKYMEIEELDEHIRREHGVDSYQCSKDCGKNFETVKRLIEHEEQECGKTTNIEQNTEEDNEKCYQERQRTDKEQNKEKQNWTCHLCQKQYRCKKELEEHGKDED